MLFSLPLLFDCTHKQDRHGHICEQDRHGHICEQDRHGHICEQDRHGPICEQDRHGPICEQDRQGHICEQDRHGHICEQDNYEVQVISAHAAFVQTPVPITISNSHLISHSMLFQLPLLQQQSENQK